MNPVAEQIDERILRLLGLEDVFDLDYDTYRTLLREAMVKGANKLPQEELELLANERKRIRGIEGRLSPTPRKITVDSISGIGNIISKKVALPGAGILALSQKTAQLQQEAASQPQEQLVQQPIPQDQFVELNQTLSSILDSVNRLYDLEIRKSEEDARLAEKRSRRIREDSSESAANVTQKASQAFENVVAPFQNILDKIFGFIKFIFLGKIFLQLVEWLKDPSNVEKIQSLGRFLKDFWPLLLALYIRPLRGFVFKLIGNLLQFSGRLASKALGPIFSRAGGVLSRFAGRAIPGIQTGVGLGLAGVRAFQGDFKGAALAAGSAIPGPIGLGFLAADVGRSVSGYAGGGLVDGEKGIDKVPAMLTEGEVVINRKTVDAIGAEVFLALNRLYGGPGANKPKMMKFNTGGLVGKEQPLVNQKAMYIYNRLISRGLTSTAAMGVVSNLGVETGYTYDPSTVQGNNGPGRGLAQWQQGGRYDTDNINLVSFAKSRGTSWNDLNTQIDFIVHEMNTNPEFKQVKNILNTSKTVNEATQVFLTGYGKSGESNLENRYAVGEQLLNKVIKKPKENQVSQISEEPQKPKIDPRSFLGGEKEEEKPKTERWATDPRGWFGMKGGAIVDNENSMRIDVPPNASDTQAAALQLGEAVLPKGTVDLLGENLIKQIIAKTDRDSNAAKDLIKSDVNRYTPTPLSNAGMGGMMTLPPQVLSGGDQMMSSANGSLVPPFQVQAAAGASTRVEKIDMYGIGIA